MKQGERGSKDCRQSGGEKEAVLKPDNYVRSKPHSLGIWEQILAAPIYSDQIQVDSLELPHPYLG